ncbi:hypothetical protein BKA80DRAFT_271066 [Phyllosticta citrichinensis]
MALDLRLHRHICAERGPAPTSLALDTELGWIEQSRPLGRLVATTVQAHGFMRERSAT